MARKILLTHMVEADQHKIEEVVETLASKLYFHGHPINRKEAKNELGLKVADNPNPQLETAMWKLYLDFETDLRNRDAYDPMSEIFKAAGPIVIPDAGQACVVPAGTNVTQESTYAIVESGRLSSAFKAEQRFVVAANGTKFEPLVRLETLKQGWIHETAPEPAPSAATP
jgi:hypothetical protein